MTNESVQTIVFQQFIKINGVLLLLCSNLVDSKINLSFIVMISASAQSDVSGPVFVQEPPNQVDFSNTTGAEIICQSRGTPLPRITWVKTDGTVIKDVPGLRQVFLKSFPVVFLIIVSHIAKFICADLKSFLF